MSAYKSLRGVGLATMILLGLNAAAVTLSLPSAMAQLELAGRIEIGDYDDAELTSNDLRQQLLGLAQTGLYLVTAIVFVVWFHRAYTNLRAWDHLPAHGTGWAIGGWFVPILSLFRPYQIARETWWASAPQSPEESVLAPSGPPLLAAWWGAWIIDNILGQITFRVSMAVETPSGLKAATVLQMANDLVMFVAAVLALLVVRGLTKRQEDRAAGGGLSPGELDALHDTFE